MLLSQTRDLPLSNLVVISSHLPPQPHLCLHYLTLASKQPLRSPCSKDAPNSVVLRL